MKLDEARRMAQAMCRYEHRSSVVLCYNEDRGYYIMPYIYKCNPNEAMYFCDNNGKLSEVGNLTICIEV